MKRVLVTGGSGFLGSHIADALTREGHSVVIFDRVESPYRTSNQDLIIGELGDRAAVERAVDGADIVYHLAGFADLNAARTQPIDTVESNIRGTINLLEAVREKPIGRFLFASTVYVYSREGGFYRCSKQACESYIEEYRRAFGIPYTVLRYGSLYGPRSNESNGVFRLLRQAIQDGRIDYVGRPDDLREYINVEDAAALSVEALQERYTDQHLVITGNSTTRAADLFTMFSEILGTPIDVTYEDSAGPGSGHYSVTPYAFTPKPGRKLATNHFVDMGQGILRLVEEIHGKQSNRKA